MQDEEVSFGEWEWTYKPCCADVTLLSTFFPVDPANDPSLNLTGNIKFGPVLVVETEKDQMTVCMGGGGGGDRYWTFCVGDAAKTFTWINPCMLKRLMDRKRKIMLYLSRGEDELISVVKMTL